MLGKTGMGKSTLLFNLIHSDITAGRGVADRPSWGLADAVLTSIPSSGPTTSSSSMPVIVTGRWPSIRSHARPVAASVGRFGGALGFQALRRSWGPRLEHIRNALLALVEIPGASLIPCSALLSDAKWRRGDRLARCRSDRAELLATGVRGDATEVTNRSNLTHSK